MYQKAEVIIKDYKQEGTRGVALGVRQLSRLQHAILILLLNEHMIISNSGSDKERNEFYTKGTKWSAKSFFQDCPTNSEKAALSRALGRLAKRGLVVLYDTAQGRGSKPRTTHVKLTEYAVNAGFLNWVVNHSYGREVALGLIAELEARKTLTSEEVILLNEGKRLIKVWETHESIARESC